MFYVFDLDGTIADVEHRKFFVRDGRKDWRLFYRSCVADKPNLPVIAALKAHLDAGHRVEIWSGRSDEVRMETEDWLKAHGISHRLLVNMRAEKDYTPDDELKRRWLKASDRRPDGVYDDRDKVVAMWRAEGIACFQVAPGDF